MNKDIAINFLKQHQPLPKDKDLTKEIITEYDEIRKYFLKYTDIDCIPLFLNSFGDGSGFGVYQLVEDVIVKFDKEKVLPHLVVALRSENKGVKYWCAQIASRFPADCLMEPLSELITDNDPDVRIMASIALGTIGGKQVVEVLENALISENDEDVIEAMHDNIKRANKGLSNGITH